MAFTKTEKEKVEKALEVFMEKRRPPAHIRPKLDIRYRIYDQSVEIYEVRPNWRSDINAGPTESSCAKTTYLRNRAIWEIYWMRKDMKWHNYEPASPVGTIEKALAIVLDDKHGCFFG